MKKIIENKLFNTETAEVVGRYTNDLLQTDFRYMEETLCKKKTGEYFLYGYGGAMSKYCKECADGWSGSEQITPLSLDEAKAWAEEHLDADAYIKEFGEVEE